MGKSKKVVWFHRARGVAWAFFGLISFMMGWQNNISLVWFASVYANALTDWGAGEAADDRELHAKLDKILELLEARE